MHCPSGQHAPQSPGHDWQVSPLSQSLLPQQAPQSPGHDVQVSPLSHWLLPQQAPQSPGHDLQVSSPPQLLLPQISPAPPSETTKIPSTRSMASDVASTSVADMSAKVISSACPGRMSAARVKTISMTKGSPSTLPPDMYASETGVSSKDMMKVNTLILPSPCACCWRECPATSFLSSAHTSSGPSMQLKLAKVSLVWLKLNTNSKPCGLALSRASRAILMEHFTVSPWLPEKVQNSSVGHTPQSPGQLSQVSSPLHRPSGQAGHTPQSWVQVEQVSSYWASHTSLPQQGSQSCLHETQVSPKSHRPLPQQGSQSSGQRLQFSSCAQMPSPQQSGQSWGQLSQFSAKSPSQLPSPQQMPQSAGQVKQLSTVSKVSSSSQSPLGQTESHAPQSSGQVLQFSTSESSHRPSPQSGTTSHEVLASPGVPKSPSP